MKQYMKYGLIIDKIEEGDYVLGGVSMLPKEELQPDGDWTPFLPKKEVQNLNGIEPYACVAFTILNCVEILIKRKYGLDRNYSDRFLAAISGTKEGGNSPQRVAEFLRKAGVVKQEDWAFDESIDTFEKFYEPLPPKLLELAREFNREWDFKHEYVEGQDIDEAIKYSPLLMSVAAWHNDGQFFYKPSGASDNHATTYVRKNLDHRLVFDSYDNHLKKVHLNAIPKVAKRFWIKKKSKKQLTLRETIKRLWRLC